MERHGGAVAADLRRYYGLPVRALFSGELAPDEAWDLIVHLPRDSATWAAVYADPETVIGDDGGPAAEPRLTEFSPEAERLADVSDRLASLIAIVSGALSKQQVKIPPSPRPGDARRARAKAMRREQARREWAELCAQMGVEVL
jgi:hypothetical protein